VKMFFDKKQFKSVIASDPAYRHPERRRRKVGEGNVAGEITTSRFLGIRNDDRGMG